MFSRRVFLCAVVMTLAVILVQGSKDAKKDPKECEVCIGVLEKVDALLEGDDKKKKPKIEAAIDKFCQNKSIDPKEKKVCYYLDKIKRDVAQPFSTGMPKAKVCERLNKKMDELCTVKYPVKVDQATDYSKLKVKELRAILAQRGVDCVGCAEKSDFVKKAQETAHLDL